MSFYGRPEFPEDVFHFGELTLFLILDRQERIRHWSYEVHGGPVAALEQIGTAITGQKLHAAWKYCAQFPPAQAVYWQLGRLLGYWPPELERGHLICRCFGVDREQLLEQLKKNPESDLGQLRSLTRASIGCGSCRPEVEQIVQEHRDYHALVVKGQGRPLGKSPVEFLQDLHNYFEKWRHRHPEHLSKLRFMGIRHYQVILAGFSGEERALQDFVTESRRELKVNWQVQRFDGPHA